MKRDQENISSSEGRGGTSSPEIDQGASVPQREVMAVAIGLLLCGGRYSQYDVMDRISSE